jgi:hypothetical protein
MGSLRNFIAGCGSRNGWRMAVAREIPQGQERHRRNNIRKVAAAARLFQDFAGSPS